MYLAIYVGPLFEKDSSIAKVRLEEILKENNIQSSLRRGITAHFYVPNIKEDEAEKLAEIINKKDDYCAKPVPE